MECFAICPKGDGISMKNVTEKDFLDFISRKEDKRHLISEVFDDFTNSIIPELSQKKVDACHESRNVYQISGAAKLSSANTVTRTYNTELGLLWEKIADLAPNVVSPELDFHFKIPEVDVIVLYEDKLYYTQLKTQRNTLTGSQGNRTVDELKKFPYNWFVACIDTDVSWTAPRTLNRLVGREFWDKIGIDYDKDILLNLKKSIMKIEETLM